MGVVDFVRRRVRRVHSESDGLMKKKIGAVLVMPFVWLIGWFTTRLSESYERSLDQLEFDFEDDDE